MIGRMDVQADADSVAAHVADWLIDAVAASAAPLRVALSGGSTPKKMFAALAQPQRAARMAWGKLHLFWGDERFVGYDSPDSNYGECRRILLDHVPIPDSQVHPVPVDGTAESAAARYEAVLRAEADGGPLFAVNFLGLGEDGHTASLIPGQPVLEERTRWVAVVGQGRPEVRITMTYPALEDAATVAFLVTGAGKRDILRALAAGTSDAPAAKLRPNGETIWFVDQAAWPGG